MSTLIANTLQGINTIKYDANTTAATIDSSGRMTQPANPAFIAIATGSGWTSITQASDYEIPFNNTRLNRGNHFSTSTYKFTAPIDCVMMFQVQVYMDSSSANYTRLRFYENNTTLVHELITDAPECSVPEGASQSQVLLDVTAGRTYQWKVYKDGNSPQVYLPAAGTTHLMHCWYSGYMVA